MRRLAGLGQSNITLPPIIEAALDPFYESLERRAISTIEENYGPYIVGAVAGLLLWNVFVTVKFSRKLGF